MATLWQRIIKCEKGQALPIVLALLVFGGLVIAPSLSFASSSLQHNKTVKENTKGIYAAEAGIEHALWKIRNGTPPPLTYDLPSNINQMQVDIQTQNLGLHTLGYFDTIENVSQPYHTWLHVSGQIVWDEVQQAYKFTITVTTQEEAGWETIHLKEVGARLPLGYSYQLGSADRFPTNLSRDDPIIDRLDGAGAHMLGWEFEPPRPSVNKTYPVAPQSFYITGQGELEGYYTWVVAVREDIGTVGELTGTLYFITATATRPEGDKITAIVTAQVIFDATKAETRILRWQLSR